MTTSIVTDRVFKNYIGKGNFLSDYPGAIVAYSLRTIGTSYVGPLIRVRRSSDNQERDFYAHYGAVVVDEVKNFVGAGSGFVSVWYDQSGNGNHAFQTIADNQPMVIKNGIVTLLNNKNCLMFDGASDYMQLPSTVAQQFNDGGVDFSVFAASNPSSNAAPFPVLSLAGNNNEVAGNNDMMLFQANAAFGASPRRAAGAIFRKVGAVDVYGLSDGAPVQSSPVIFGVIRESGNLTVVDTSSPPTDTPAATTGALNLSLATMGATRRGSAGSVETSNPNSKISELIVYRKSYASVLDDVMKNMTDYYG